MREKNCESDSYVAFVLNNCDTQAYISFLEKKSLLNDKKINDNIISTYLSSIFDNETFIMPPVVGESIFCKGNFSQFYQKVV